MLHAYAKTLLHLVYTADILIVWKRVDLSLLNTVVFNLFAGAEPQQNLSVTRGTPVQ